MSSRSAPRIPRPPFNPSTQGFCTHCKKVKSRTEFPKSKSTPSGLHGWCRACNNAGVKAWENDPANYRKRRDAQAQSGRRYAAIKKGREPSQEPIRVRQTVPPALRPQRSAREAS